MTIKLGKAVSAPTLTLEDWLKHSLWIRLPESRYRDELCVKPILAPDSVTREVLRIGMPVVVLFHNDDLDKYGCATVLNERKLYNISLWWGKYWRPVDRIKVLRFPFQFTVIPGIVRTPSPRFVVKRRADVYATRLKP